MMSIQSSPWPMENSGCFQADRFDYDSYVYRLDLKQVDENKCHVFFVLDWSPEVMALKLMESGCKHLSHEGRFEVSIVKCNKIYLGWYQFPKECKEACERVVKAFHMVMQSDLKLVRYFGSKQPSTGCEDNEITLQELEVGTVIEFPCVDRILWLERQPSLR
jgi:hypothetical protein